MHALDWKWPIDVVMSQDQARLDDLLKIEGWYQELRDWVKNPDARSQSPNPISI
jgi:hypothetical protein